MVHIRTGKEGYKEAKTLFHLRLFYKLLSDAMAFTTDQGIFNRAAALTNTTIWSSHCSLMTYVGHKISIIDILEDPRAILSLHFFFVITPAMLKGVPVNS